MKKPLKNTLPIKTHKAILDNYNLIKSKKYTEKHIKELLVDLRLVANLSKNSFKQSPFIEGINEFIDFCNFIAHPIKDRGFIAKRIIENIDLLKQSLINPDELIQPENNNLYFDKLKTYPCNNYIAHMFTMIYLALQKNINQDELEMVSKLETEDISLCILSLLQNSIIELDTKDIDKAVLILNSNENQLFIYSVIYSDKINNQFTESGFNPSSDSSIFMLPTVSSDITHIQVNQTNRNQPQFYETFRDLNNHLKIRII